MILVARDAARRAVLRGMASLPPPQQVRTGRRCAPRLTCTLSLLLIRRTPIPPSLPPSHLRPAARTCAPFVGVFHSQTQLTTQSTHNTPEQVTGDWAPISISLWRQRKTPKASQKAQRRRMKKHPGQYGMAEHIDVCTVSLFCFPLHFARILLTI